MQNTKPIPEPRRCESAKYKYKKSSYVEIFKELQSLRKDEMFCDFKLETDDGKIICGHKVVLASASAYFHAMFKNCEEKNQYLVIMKQLDSTALQLIVNFIYSGEITVTENNLQVLLQASNLLQLQEVKEACCDFLQAQMCPKNCIAINALADLHGCSKLLSNSELYIQQHFLDVVEGDEFLSLSSEQMVKLIACDELKVPSEEKVFESVIRWVKYDLSSRKCLLPQLMEHVRLPLIPKDYLLKKIAEEPLVNNCLKSTGITYPGRGGPTNYQQFAPAPYPPMYPSTIPPINPALAADVQETAFLFIPNSAVHAIIGIKGSNIRSIIRYSGASVKIASTENEKQGVVGNAGDENSAQQASRKVTIVGTADSQWKAQGMIFDKLRDEGFVPNNEEVRLTVEILVPSSQVGRIIGRGGSNVRELQRVTGSIIKLPTQGSTDGTEDTTTVHIIGHFLATQSAQRRIRSMVASGANPVPCPQQRNSRPTETPQQ